MVTFDVKLSKTMISMNTRFKFSAWLLALAMMLPLTLFGQDDVYYTPEDYYNGGQPDYTTSDGYATESGDTYITNNNYYYGEDEYVYYDDNDYDYYYSSRIRRFNNPYRGFSYYDPCYTDLAWYNPDPFYYGSSIYYRPYRPFRIFRPRVFVSWGWGGGYYASSWYRPWRPWRANNWGYNNWGYNDPFANPYGFGNPYGGFNSVSYNPYCPPIGGNVYNQYNYYGDSGGSSGSGGSDGYTGGGTYNGPRSGRGGYSGDRVVSPENGVKHDSGKITDSRGGKVYSDDTTPQTTTIYNTNNADSGNGGRQGTSR